MLKPAGIDPHLIREAPWALADEQAMRAACLQALQQASGVRTTRWASTREIQRVMILRGESAHDAVLMLPQLLDEGQVEQQARADGLYWRRVL